MEKRSEYVADSDTRKGAKMFPLRMVRPTSGMNIGKVEMCGCKCNFWDLGGAEKMRILWERYYADADAVVFVIDSVSTQSKLEEARDAFFHIMDKEVLDGIPTLVFATKADLIGEGEAEVKEESKPRSPTNKEVVNGEDPPDDSPSFLTFEELAELFELHEDGSLRTYDNITFRQGSAKTGEGVKAAFEWLIPRAKQIQRNRGKHQ
uniref:Uncharacterized protein n=2 Tax=Helicotheca tamesis TaxID=374047 RepID=A0A7S2HYN3_9STRA|mmetsp:Transcript_4056/g.5486  ORF Transcript_4056/g.5486 Transcript_4056/m.5486 type:complete len:206 (+) Transcript_4056:590-1207(+)